MYDYYNIFMYVCVIFRFFSSQESTVTLGATTSAKVGEDTGTGRFPPLTRKGDASVFSTIAAATGTAPTSTPAPLRTTTSKKSDGMTESWHARRVIRTQQQLR